MPPSDIQARCFSGLPFWKVFRRRDPVTPVYTHAIPSVPSNRGTDHAADHVVRVLHACNMFQALNVVQKDSFFLEKDWLPDLSMYSDHDWNLSRTPTVLGPEFVATIENELDDLSRKLRVISLGIHGMSIRTSSFYSGITLVPLSILARPEIGFEERFDMIIYRPRSSAYTGLQIRP